MKQIGDFGLIIFESGKGVYLPYGGWRLKTTLELETICG
jgi:hypothetical protein